MSPHNSNPTPERDDVGTLVHLAGKRREVPPQRTERVRAVAHAAWQDQVRDRRRRRTAWTVAAMAVAAALLLLVGAPDRSRLNTPPDEQATLTPTAAAVVEVVIGTLGSRQPDADGRLLPARVVAPGDRLVVGTRLETDGHSRAAVRLGSGHSLRLDLASAVRLEQDRIELERGGLYIDSGPLARSDTDEPAASRPTTTGLLVATVLGTVQEIGTQFEVRLLQAALQVRLREGAVVVRDDAVAHQVQAGGELRLTMDGRVVRGSVAKAGPAWDWLGEITPMLDLEGRSAGEFVAWVARERGLRLQYASDDLAREAATIELGGTIAGLSLDQALDAVLPTCRLGYRIVGDELLTVTAAH